MKTEQLIPFKIVFPSFGHTMPCSSSVTSLCMDDELILCGLESGLIEIFDRSKGFNR